MDPLFDVPPQIELEPIYIMAILASIIKTHHKGAVLITPEMLSDISGCRLTIEASLETNQFEVRVHSSGSLLP